MNNNNDISNLLQTLNNMDKNQLQKGVNKLNAILSDEDKKKILNMLNGKK